MNCNATERPRTIVLCLGNELLADDAIGIRAAEILAERMSQVVSVVASSQSGLALLEVLAGYDRAIIVDAIQTGKRPPGQIQRLTPSDLKDTYAPSPHYAGLPEMFAIAKHLQLRFPTRIDLVAVEVKDTSTLGGEITAEVRSSLGAVVDEVESILAKTHPERPYDA